MIAKISDLAARTLIRASIDCEADEEDANRVDMYVSAVMTAGRYDIDSGFSVERREDGWYVVDDPHERAALRVIFDSAPA